MAETEVLHASAVAIAGRGLLILGPSGSGKSSLALALIARGAALVADDRTLFIPGTPPRLGAPRPLAGLIEARGIGLIRLAEHVVVPLALVVDLAEAAAARLPPATVTTLHGCTVPLIMGRNRPGLADAVFVLMSQGQLIDPDGRDPGQESAE